MSKVATLQLQIHYEGMTAHKAARLLDNLLTGALSKARSVDSEKGQPEIAVGSFFVEDCDPEEAEYLETRT